MAWNLGRRGRLRRGRVAHSPVLERLEQRQLCYVPSGTRWADPTHITYSIVADGVFWDHGYSNLNASMNARFGNGVWQRELARALETWVAVANINIAQTTDDNSSFNSPGLSQGDPRFGDIRIGGYPFLDPATLAQTYYPPPNGLTAAGDSEINTGITWSLGSGTDLYSGMLHEFGHALGLDHSLTPGAVMSATYGGVRTGLTPDDVAGIQSIYGPRTPDAFQSSGQGVSFATAIDLTPRLDASGQASVPSASLHAIGDAEYFTVVAPPGGGTLQATAVAAGVSLLSPQVKVLDASQRVLDMRGNAGAWGDNVSATVGSTLPGQRYYIVVAGATQDALAIGAYQLQVQFSGGSAPGPPDPPRQPGPPVPASVPVLPDRFEPNNDLAHATDLGPLAQVLVVGLTLDSVLDTDTFQFRAARGGSYAVAAPGTIVRVLDSRGRLVAEGAGATAFRATRAGSRFFLMVSPASPAPEAGYFLGVAVTPRTLVRGARRRTFAPGHLAAPEVATVHALPTGPSLRNEGQRHHAPKQPPVR